MVTMTAVAMSVSTSRKKRTVPCFFVLVLVLLGTAVVVTIAMFQTLYYLLG